MWKENFQQNTNSNDYHLLLEVYCYSLGTHYYHHYLRINDFPVRFPLLLILLGFSKTMSFLRYNALRCWKKLILSNCSFWVLKLKILQIFHLYFKQTLWKFVTFLLQFLITISDSLIWESINLPRRASERNQ